MKILKCLSICLVVLSTSVFSNDPFAELNNEMAGRGSALDPNDHQAIKISKSINENCIDGEGSSFVTSSNDLSYSCTKGKKKNLPSKDEVAKVSSPSSALVKSKPSITTSEELDDLVRAEKTDCVIMPKDIDERVTTLKKACETFKRYKKQCGENIPSYKCNNISRYKTITSRSIKGLCKSRDIESCMLHKEELIRCFKKVGKQKNRMKICKTMADQSAGARDKILKEFEADGFDGQAQYDNCMKNQQAKESDENPLAKICYEQVEKSMHDGLVANIDEECPEVLQGAINGDSSIGCNGSTWVQKGSSADAMGRFINKEGKRENRSNKKSNKTGSRAIKNP